MENFCFFCKTYKNDLENFDRLIKSFNKYNYTKITLYISCPQNDKDLFVCYESDNVKIITDEAYANCYMTNKKETGFSIGYINQEICKLSFWETGFALNYCCLDSDALFIREFDKNDFMYDEITPFSVLVMDKELATWNLYRDFWEVRASQIDGIFKAVGNNDSRRLTCHGFQTLNKKILEDFKSNYLIANGKTYYDCIKQFPFEFTWYNAWLQKRDLIDIRIVEPQFYTFHNKLQYFYARLHNMKIENFARSYVGVVLNSNWYNTKIKKRNGYENPSIFLQLISKIINFLGSR